MWKTAEFQTKYRKKISRTKIFYDAVQMGCLFGVVAMYKFKAPCKFESVTKIVEK